MVFSFKENVYNFYYYDYEDIFSFLGGIVASMQITLNCVTLGISIHFIWSMAKLLLRKYEYIYKT